MRNSRLRLSGSISQHAIVGATPLSALSASSDGANETQLCEQKGELDALVREKAITK